MNHLRYLTTVAVAAAALSVPAHTVAVSASAIDRDCSDIGTQAAVQAYVLALGGPTEDPERLDSDGDGNACESDRCRCDYRTTPIAAPAPPKLMSFKARIVDVVDGDTIEARRADGRRYTVRLIGIDTPETKQSGTPVECGGREATSNMLGLAFTRPRDRDGDGLNDERGGTGRSVTLRTDSTQATRDRYGRLLAYAASSSKGNLAIAQLRAGWAAVYVFDQPFEQLAEFDRAQAAASAGHRGVWSMCGGNFHTPA